MALLALVAASGPAETAIVVRVAGEATANEILAIEQSAARGLRWIVDTDALGAAGQRAVAEASRRCTDNDCLFAVGAQHEVDRLLYVVASPELSPPLITVEVLDPRAKKVLAEVVVQVKTNLADAVRGGVEDALRSAGHEVGGALLVDVVPAGASIAVSGAAWPPGVERPIAAGAYDLDVRADGYEPSSRRVEAALRAQTRVALNLEPVASVFERWWFWTAVGAAVAGGVVATVVLTRPEPDEACLPVAGGSC